MQGVQSQWGPTAIGKATVHLYDAADSLATDLAELTPPRPGSSGWEHDLATAALVTGIVVGVVATVAGVGAVVWPLLATAEDAGAAAETAETLEQISVAASIVSTGFDGRSCVQDHNTDACFAMALGLVASAAAGAPVIGSALNVDASTASALSAASLGGGLIGLSQTLVDAIASGERQ
jgi:hypothetical protein